jgi:hypothetical protein
MLEAARKNEFRSSGAIQSGSNWRPESAALKAIED